MPFYNDILNCLNHTVKYNEIHKRKKMSLSHVTFSLLLKAIIKYITKKLIHSTFVQTVGE